MAGRCVITVVVTLVGIVLFGSIFGGACSRKTKTNSGTCSYSEWSEWSRCSQQCGPYGTQFRVRNVQAQVIGDGSVVCTEPTYDEQPCNRECYNGGSLSQDGCNCRQEYSGPCCECEDIDCQLSQWSNWSSCEKVTSRVRSRDVVRYSECAGTKCKGPYSEEQDCSVVLKGNVLVPKELIITIILYAGLVTVAIISIGLHHKFRKKQDSRTQNNSYLPSRQDDDNDSYQGSVESETTITSSVDLISG